MSNTHSSHYNPVKISIDQQLIKAYSPSPDMAQELSKVKKSLSPEIKKTFKSSQLQKKKVI